jgi:ribosome-associated protein
LARLVRKKQEAAEPAEEEKGYLDTVHRIANMIADKKAKDIKAFDVQGLTLVADAFVICTATSEPQSKAIYNTVKDGMREFDRNALRTEGTFHSGWLLIDYGDVIVHIFREKERDFYDLDGMWADAREIELKLD